MKQLKIENLSKRYSALRRDVTALQSISLIIEPREFFVLLGPSGCGKSTLLNVLAGLEKPSEGAIHYGDTVFADTQKNIALTPKERNVAMVFQNYALYPHMSVEDNIGFPLKLMKMTKDERDTRILEAASMLQIESLLSAKPGELSGGQRQRVAIARAIVRKPSLFLLDEPLSNLDAQLRTSTRNYLKQLQKKLGITTIYVTHDQVEAMTLGDRIAVLNKGGIEQIGTPDELYNSPVNPFVGSFIGSPQMNLLDAEIYSDKDSLKVTLCGTNFKVPDRWVKKLPKNVPGKVTVGIRPEHITLCTSPDTCSIEVEVTGFERVGRETTVFVQKNGCAFTLIAHETPNNGDALTVSFDLEKAHCFNP